MSAEIIDLASVWRKLRCPKWPLPDQAPNVVEVMVGRKIELWTWSASAPIAPEGATHWRHVAA